MRKLLATRESPCVQPLRELIEKQKHRTLALWATDCAEPILLLFEKRRPGDGRPRAALEAARAWMRGEIKMPIARKAALESHKAAAEAEMDGDPAACAAARSMGHVVGTVHVETHALGFVIYALTALVREAPERDPDEVMEDACSRLLDRLLEAKARIEEDQGPWAPFLIREDVPNKEALLRVRLEEKRRLY